MDTFHAVNMKNCFKKGDISGNNKLFTENDFGNAFFTLLAAIKNKICDDVLEDYVNPNEHL